MTAPSAARLPRLAGAAQARRWSARAAAVLARHRRPPWPLAAGILAGLDFVWLRASHSVGVRRQTRVVHHWHLLAPKPLCLALHMACLKAAARAPTWMGAPAHQSAGPARQLRQRCAAGRAVLVAAGPARMASLDQPPTKTAAPPAKTAAPHIRRAPEPAWVTGGPRFWPAPPVPAAGATKRHGNARRPAAPPRPSATAAVAIGVDPLVYRFMPQARALSNGMQGVTPPRAAPGRHSTPRDPGRLTGGPVPPGLAGAAHPPVQRFPLGAQSDLRVRWSAQPARDHRRAVQGGDAGMARLVARGTARPDSSAPAGVTLVPAGRPALSPPMLARHPAIGPAAATAPMAKGERADRGAHLEGTRLHYRRAAPAAPRPAEQLATTQDLDRRVHAQVIREIERERGREHKREQAVTQRLATLLSPPMLKELADLVYAVNQRRAATEMYRKGSA